MKLSYSFRINISTYSLQPHYPICIYTSNIKLVKISMKQLSNTCFYAVKC